MKTPQISVIVPMFNEASRITRLLDSVITQTFTDIEVIIINDGSTDNSAEIATSYCQKDARVKIHHQTNQGLSSARNTGLKYAQGEWIVFFDSDDFIKPELLAHWYQLAVTQHVDVLIGNGERFNPSDLKKHQRPIHQRQPYQKVIKGSEWIIYAVTQHQWPHFVWLQLIRHDLIKKYQLRFIEGLYHEDILWTTQLALAAERIGFDNQPLYYYCANPDSITRKPDPQKEAKRTQSYLQIILQLLKEADKQSDQLLAKALRQQAIRELGSFFILFRKCCDAKNQKIIAKQFSSCALFSSLNKGVTDWHQRWFIFRVNCILFITSLK
ncbi:glycosyltransferase [Proteus genomosp. 4]|uniref:glycosyltransferase n=1 Tax=Proteus genomosp. 4 TaxID=1311818 RepID=UPI000D696B95|nr:glycosyltransferase [Proteus genomosp. 4]